MRITAREAISGDFRRSELGKRARRGFRNGERARYLGLVGGEGDVDLLESLDPLGRQRVADLLEPVIRAD